MSRLVACQKSGNVLQLVSDCGGLMTCRGLVQEQRHDTTHSVPFLNVFGADETSSVFVRVLVVAFSYLGSDTGSG